MGRFMAGGWTGADCAEQNGARIKPNVSESASESMRMEFPVGAEPAGASA